MNFSSLSLRYKFLIIISILLSAAIFSYLMIAVNLFNDDKLAYIYDSNASLTGSLASESETLLFNAIETSELIAQSLTSSAHGRLFAERLFAMNPNMVFIEVFRANEFLNANSPRPLFSSLKSDFLEPYDLTDAYYKDILQDDPIPRQKLTAQRYVLKASGRDNRVPLLTLAIVTNSTEGQKDDRIIVTHIRQDRLLTIFSRTDLYHTYLINFDGDILLHSRDDAQQKFTSPKVLSDLKASQIKTAATSYKNNDQEFILAYAKIDRLNIAVVSEIDTEVAFLASHKLIEKSVQFALLIFLVSFIVSLVFTKQVTAALRHLYYATLAVSRGEFDTKVEVRSTDEIGALATSFNTMSQKIVSLLKEEKVKTRLEGELATAQTVQNTFFPNQTKTFGPLTISGKYQPAAQCGGDWWGHVEGQDGVHYIFIADAMGHGLPAALVTAMAYSSCQTLAEIIKADTSLSSPAQILGQFNKVLYNAVRGEISMTFFAMKIDTKKGKITYANAGHNFPILFPLKKDDKRAHKVQKSFQKISERPPINLSVQGTPLGINADAKFTEEVINILPGDKFLLFTDGIIECSNPQGETWGRKKLIKNVLEMVEEDADTLQNKIMERALNFFGDRPINDDLTVVVLEISEDYAVRSLSYAS